MKDLKSTDWKTQLMLLNQYSKLQWTDTQDDLNFFPWKLFQEYLIWSQGDDSVNKILAAQHKALSMFISSAPT